MGSGKLDHKALAPESDELPEVQLELFFGRSIDKAHCSDTTVDMEGTAGHNKRALCRGCYVSYKSSWFEVDLPACEGT